jgi:hypothetical protein
MKKIMGLMLGLALMLGAVSIAAAQEMASGVTPPPKVLVIEREFLKPGKMGSVHERSESAFVQAFTRAKWPTHYFALDSMSGKPRSLFLIGYDSFDAWEKDYQAMQKNPALAAAMDRAGLADGELQSDADQSVLTYSEEYSLRAPVKIAQMRMFEISLYRVRSGHRKDWDQLLKLVLAAYEKVPDAHWAAYELRYGQQEGTTYALFSPLKSAAEIDRESAQDREFVAAMGPDGMKKLGELEEAAIESSQTNLFMFNPRMSYVSEDWVKADPQFWKPTPPAMPKKAMEKPEEKPPSQ